MGRSAGDAAVKIGGGSSSTVSLVIRGDHEVHDGSHFYQDNDEAIYSPMPISALVHTESGGRMPDGSISVREEKSRRRHRSMGCCENRNRWRATRSVWPGYAKEPHISGSGVTGNSSNGGFCLHDEIATIMCGLRG